MRSGEMDEQEWALRRDLAACLRLLGAWGWDDLVANHASVRLGGETEAFLINPFGLLFEEVTASSLLKIDLDGQLLEPTPYAVNQAGFVIHSAIHEARPDARCVVHLHTVDGVAVSMLEGGVLPLDQTSITVADDLSYHEYEGVAVELDERGRLAADLGSKHHMLLRNHGTLTIGASVASAFVRTYFLERSCAVQMRAFGTGRMVHEPDPIAVKKVGEHLDPEALERFAENVVWPAMLRRAARIAPDYAE